MTYYNALNEEYKMKILLIYNMIIAICFLLVLHLTAGDDTTSSYSISIISETNNEINDKIKSINTVLNDSKTDNYYKNSSILENIIENINATQLVLNVTNSDVEQTIISVIPGIPIFKKPPEIKILDPDEGPLEPFLHPSNNSEIDSDMPSTSSPNQQYIWIRKPEFVAEKGSLEEKYKSLLADVDSDDVTLPPEFTNDNSTQTKLISNMKPNTASAKNISLKNVFRSPIPRYYPPLASQYAYPYQPFMYMMPSLIPQPQYYPTNIAQRMPFVYKNNYNSRLIDGERLKALNSTKHSIPQSIESSIAKHDIEALYKVLPKSYLTHGASIQQVAINSTNESELMIDADIDSLEMLGPIELKQEENVDEHFTTNMNHLLVNTNKFSGSKGIRVSEQLRHSNGIKMTTTKTKDKILPKESLLGLHVVYENNEVPIINNRKMANNNFYVNRNSHYQPLKSQKQNHRHILKAIDSNQNRNNNFRSILSDNDDNSHRWKKTIKPKFLFRANFADSKLIIRDKDKSRNKWWNSEQPSYCLEPIYVDTNCRNKKLTKRWSFNEIDHKCYFYKDVCAHVKQNSFLTSRDCFLKCWRISD